MTIERWTTYGPESGPMTAHQLSPALIYSRRKSSSAFPIRIRIVDSTGSASPCFSSAKSASQRYGERPWRSAQELDPLMDEEMPGLAYQ